MRLRIPYITTNIETDIINTIYLAPLWWISGLSIFVYHLVTLWLFLKMTVIRMAAYEKIKVPRITVFLIIMIFIYGFSLLINYPNNEFSRTTASLYNYSFWIMGLMLIVIVYNMFNENSVKRFAKALLFNIKLIGIISLMALLLWVAGHREFHYPTLMLKAFPSMVSSAHLKFSATINILETDWFFGRLFPRISVMAVYPTALGGFLLLSLPMIFAVRYVVEYGSKTRMRHTVALALGIIAFILTLSRSPLMSAVIAATFVHVVNRKNRLAFFTFGAAVMVFVVPFFIELFLWVNEIRGGSSAYRFNVYRETVNLVFEKNALLGIGIKPREKWHAIPLGSHSMYLSLLLKTGVLGLLAFAAFQFHIVKTWYGYSRVKWRSKELKMLYSGIGVALIGAMLFFITEDLDAPQLMAFVYFLIVGSFAAILRRVNEGCLTQN